MHRNIFMSATEWMIARPIFAFFLSLNFYMKNSNKSIVHSTLCMHIYLYTYVIYVHVVHSDGCFGQEKHSSSSSLILSVCQYTPNGTFYIIIDEMVNEEKKRKKNSFKCVYELNSFEWLIDSNGWMWDVFGASWIFQRVSIQSCQNFITNGLGHFFNVLSTTTAAAAAAAATTSLWWSIAMKIVQDFANNVDLSHLGAFYLL